MKSWIITLRSVRFFFSFFFRRRSFKRKSWFGTKLWFHWKIPESYGKLKQWRRSLWSQAPPVEWYSCKLGMESTFTAAERCHSPNGNAYPWSFSSKRRHRDPELVSARKRTLTNACQPFQLRISDKWCSLGIRFLKACWISSEINKRNGDVFFNQISRNLHLVWLNIETMDTVVTSGNRFLHRPPAILFVPRVYIRLLAAFDLMIRESCDIPWLNKLQRRWG